MRTRYLGYTIHEDAKTPRLFFDALQIVLASLFIGLLAQIRVALPFNPVPITGQTLGVMLIPFFLGKESLFLPSCFTFCRGVWADHFGKAVSAVFIIFLAQREAT